MAIKVLQVLNGLGHGGAEAFVMNMYRNIDRDKVQFDFLVRSTDNSKYEEEVKRLGGKIFITSPFPAAFWKNYKETKKFFREHTDYDIIHVHANSLIYLLPLKLSKKYGVKCRVIHSHNTRSAKSIYKIIHDYNKKKIEKYATQCFACSSIAGKWMFDGEFDIIKNAIDTNKFTFNQETRNKVRRMLKIDDKFVVGHVGRFTYQKNHKFVLEIFREIVKLNPNAVLLLIGEGELKTEVAEKANLMGIDEKIIFLGTKDNISDFLNSFDVFIFPSFFEGLPIALVEAQASGVPCLISDVISNETIVTDVVKKKSLEDSVQDWAKEAINWALKTERKNMYQEIVDSGFDMSSAVKTLENFYLQFKME